ncbi:MAG TPA: acyl-CoA desaturase [Cyanobacteria bacterium UBA8553]|nr:acyl-CoA desaturase [Cyanobacteria bacterium UBA8553]HAJ64176.1 acyl-CoA desaturase [Cyanobacteria bacterium UBA8543]
MNEDRDTTDIQKSDNPTDVKWLEDSHQRQKLTISNDYLQTIYKRLSLLTALIPSLGLIVAIGLIWRFGISPIEVGLLVSMYALTILGVEVGFHRHFAHRAFQTTTAVRVILAILGAMAAQGGVTFWVAHHRRHHQYTDLPGDPHSPHLHGDGIRGRLWGLWHSHMGWTLDGQITNSMLFAKDLLRDPVIAKVNQLQQYWVILGLVIPTVIGGVLSRTWIGALQGLIWGGLVRVFLGHHFIQSINSICHVYGGRLFDTDNYSTNNLWLAIPTWGQSWHNNHHAFPNSAIVGLKWWQIDIGAWVIRALEFVGLVWDVKMPKAETIEAKIAAKKSTEFIL